MLRRLFCLFIMGLPIRPLRATSRVRDRRHVQPLRYPECCAGWLMIATFRTPLASLPRTVHYLHENEEMSLELLPRSGGSCPIQITGIHRSVDDQSEKRGYGIIEDPLLPESGKKIQIQQEYASGFVGDHHFPAAWRNGGEMSAEARSTAGQDDRSRRARAHAPGRRSMSLKNTFRPRPGFARAASGIEQRVPLLVSAGSIRPQLKGYHCPNSSTDHS
jgi:hypothetical protein